MATPNSWKRWAVRTGSNILGGLPAVDPPPPPTEPEPAVTDVEADAIAASEVPEDQDFEFEDDTPTEPDTRVNVNEAILKDLNSLPGIGRASAERIITARTQKPFKDFEDLLQRASLTHLNTDEEKEKLAAAIRYA